MCTLAVSEYAKNVLLFLFSFFLSLNHIRVVQKNILKMLCAPLANPEWRWQKKFSFVLWIPASYVFYSVFIPPGVAGGQRGSFEPVNLTHFTISIDGGWTCSVTGQTHARPCFIWLCWFMQRWRKARESPESRFSLVARPSCQTLIRLLTSRMNAE